MQIRHLTTLWSYVKYTTLTPESKNLALLRHMNIICLMRSLSLIDIGAIWLLSLVYLLMRIIASFLRYPGYQNSIKDPISHGLYLTLAHVLLLSCR